MLLETLLHSSTAAIHGIERGDDVVLCLDLQEMSHSGITGGLRKASSGTRSVRKRPWPVSNMQY